MISPFFALKPHYMKLLTALALGLLILPALPCRAASQWGSYSPGPGSPGTPPSPYAPSVPPSPLAPGVPGGSSIYSGTDPETGDEVIRVTPRSQPSDNTQQQDISIYPQVYPSYPTPIPGPGPGPYPPGPKPYPPGPGPTPHPPGPWPGPNPHPPGPWPGPWPGPNPHPPGPWPGPWPGPGPNPPGPWPGPGPYPPPPPPGYQGGQWGGQPGGQWGGQPGQRPFIYRHGDPSGHRPAIQPSGRGPNRRP